MNLSTEVANIRFTVTDPLHRGSQGGWLWTWKVTIIGPDRDDSYVGADSTDGRTVGDAIMLLADLMDFVAEDTHRWAVCRYESGYNPPKYEWRDAFRSALMEHADEISAHATRLRETRV